MTKKTDIVREAVANKDWKCALRIAKDFRLGIAKKDKEKMRRAYECIVHSEFYVQLGIDIESSIQEGIAVVRLLYGK